MRAGITTSLTGWVRRSIYLSSSCPKFRADRHKHRLTTEPLIWAKTALHAPAHTAARVWPLVNRRNISITLGVASLFGLIAPDRATEIRNVILAPVGVEQNVGELL